MDLSLVIPLLNEEPNLRELVAQVRSVLDGLDLTSEVILVDDGSRDRSFEVIEALCQEDSRVRGVQFRKNYGKAAALSEGFRVAQGDVVITMDADLQDDPKEIPHLLAKMAEGYDLVSGWKFERHDPLSKRIPSKVFNKVTAWITGVKIHDFNCGLKAYRREVTQDIPVYGQLHRYLPVLARRQGYRIAEIKVRHHPRKHGTTKYGMGRFLYGFLDLLTVLVLTRYVTRPLHFFGGLGTMFATTGFAVGCYLTYLKLHYGNLMGRYPLLWFAILLMILGVQLFSTGLLAELVSSMRQKEEEYSVKKRVNHTA
ncbi:MAG: glycosyltransferase family 2 protein [Candidatus Latescibacterota bacterium]